MIIIAVIMIMIIIMIITCIHSIISAESAHLDQRLCEAAPQEAEHGDHEDLCNHNDEYGDGDGCREFNNDDDDDDNNDGSGGGIPLQWIGRRPKLVRLSPLS